MAGRHVKIALSAEQTLALRKEALSHAVRITPESIHPVGGEHGVGFSYPLKNGQDLGKVIENADTIFEWLRTKSNVGVNGKAAK